MKVCVITATAGRYSCLARSVAMFLEQDYENCIQLIYQNSTHPLELDSTIPTDKVLIINNSEDLVEGGRYKTLGAIYRDAITFVPKDVEIISHFDDDDLFLPTHVSEGVKGLIKGGKTAYKPKKSLFLSGNHVKSLIENTLEPSIFVKKSHVQKYGYGLETSAQHLAWVNPLVYNNDIFVDPEGVPTLLYDWNTTGIPIFKTSGDPHNPDNIENYRKFSDDFGEDGVLRPISRDILQKYYNLMLK